MLEEQYSEINLQKFVDNITIFLITTYLSILTIYTISIEKRIKHFYCISHVLQSIKWKIFVEVKI